MRCQTSGCATKTIRQDRLEAEISTQLLSLQISQTDKQRLEGKMKQTLKLRDKRTDKRALELQLANLAQREDQLTDALLDNLIDKETFKARQNRLATERSDLEELLAKAGDLGADQRLAKNFLELVKSLYLTFQIADRSKKRRLVELLFSNRLLTGQNLCLTPQKWLTEKAWTLSVLCGPPDRDRTRTRQEISKAIRELEL
jgi:exonuclease VII large subunit